MFGLIKERLKAHDKAQRMLFEMEITRLNEQIIQREKEALQAVELFKREEHENKLLRERLEPKSCDGCIHAANYRKCTSCARYPKLKDKYEEDCKNG